MNPIPMLDETIIPELQDTVYTILTRHPQGLSEFDLLEQLRSHEQPGIPLERFDNALSLFQTHFILFHVLYRLHEDLAAAGTGSLSIHALRIQLLPATAAHQAVGRPDALRDYYLDWHNLTATSQTDVESMLNRFWDRYLRQDRRGEALQVLGLDHGADDDSIRRQYRRLAMQHHPDRGGDKARLQAINEAAGLLLRKRRP